MTLIELLISFLILAIACVAWLEIIGVQSAKREARRREAVERLAGMMDAFMALTPKGKILNAATGKEVSVRNGYYRIEKSNNTLNCFSDGSADKAEQFDPHQGVSDLDPIRYQLYVVKRNDLDNASSFGSNWGTSKKWLVGKLYDPRDTINGALSLDDKPFFTVQVRLWY